MHFCYQEYETKSGRAGPGNPTSPRQSVRKNLDFEPLSTTALILEDRPAYVNTLKHTLRSLGCWVFPHFSLSLSASGVCLSDNKALSIVFLSSSLPHSFCISPPSSAGSLNSIQYCSSPHCVPDCITDGERQVLLKV